GEVFAWLLSLTGTSGLLTWMSISVTHLRFRAALTAQGRRPEDLPYRMPFFPYGNYIAIAIACAIVCGQTTNVLTADPFSFRDLASVALGIPLFASLYFGYRYFNKSGLIPLDKCDFGLEDED
ncbi:hypothetical protein HK405_010965, partial [Cladochytrium tenue]